MGKSGVLYCCIRSNACFSCSEYWFGNSPINIDEAMTNGNYGLTGQKLPLGKFQSITVSLIVQCGDNCSVGPELDFSADKTWEKYIFFNLICF